MQTPHRLPFLSWAQPLYRTKLLILLLLFTPLIYSFDGDPFRAYEVVSVALVMMMISPVRLASLQQWHAARLTFLYFITILIIVQPVFVSNVELVFNLSFSAVMAAMAVPALCLSGRSRLVTEQMLRFTQSCISVLFFVASLSVVVSFFFGVGEVYVSDYGSARAFAWMGDSFSPVMVFFLFYFFFRRSYLLAALSLVCVVALMQAKAATVMAVLGLALYLLVNGRWVTKLITLVAVGLGTLFVGDLFTAASSRIHNFDYSLNNRLLSFEAALQLSSSNRLFGIGPNQTLAVLRDGFDVASLSMYYSGLPFYSFVQVHNAFLRTFAEMGVVGLVLFLCFCIQILRACYPNLRRERHTDSDLSALPRACALWLVSFILFYQTTGWFEPGHPQLAWLLCFLALMSISDKRFQKTQRTAAFALNPIARRSFGSGARPAPVSAEGSEYTPHRPSDEAPNANQ